MRDDRKLLALLALLTLFGLAGCKGKEKPSELPTEYTVAGEAVAAFTPAEEDEATVAQDQKVGYTYDGMAAPGGAVAAYVDQMTTEETGFFVVDDSYYKSDAPDFTQPTGELLLAKSSATDGTLITVRLAWQEGSCNVTVEAPAGEIQEKPKGMTLMEAIDYVKKMEPAALGLEGDDMDSYNVYGLSGAALVDGAPCLRLSVYQDDNAEETNVLMGMYLMTSDARHIYRLDQESGEVVEVNT